MNFAAIGIARNNHPPCLADHSTQTLMTSVSSALRLQAAPPQHAAPLDPRHPGAGLAVLRLPAHREPLLLWSHIGRFLWGRDISESNLLITQPNNVTDKVLHITKFRPRTLAPYTCPHDGTDRTLRIIAAGLGRSGSTWQFNVLIVMLKMAGFDVASSHGQLDDKFAVMNRSMHCNVAVIKVHQFHPLLLARADFVFTSHRDPRDAVMSLIDLGVGLFWAQYWAEYQRWSAFACYDMAYESMWADPGAEVRRMAAVLGLQHVIDSTVRVCVSACVWCVCVWCVCPYCFTVRMPSEARQQARVRLSSAG